MMLQHQNSSEYNDDEIEEFWVVFLFLKESETVFRSNDQERAENRAEQAAAERSRKRNIGGW